MNYTELLNKIIRESGLKNVEIIAKCKEMGVSITPNYLSVLKTSNKIASEDLSRAIAKACGKHEDVLVIQSFLDKAPNQILNVLNAMFKGSLEFVNWQLKEQKPRIKYSTYLVKRKAIRDIQKDMCLAEFVAEYMSDDLDFIEQPIKEMENILNNKMNWALVRLGEGVQFLTDEQVKALQK